MKNAKPATAPEVTEIYPDAWERFEKAVDKVMDAPRKPPPLPKSPRKKSSGAAVPDTEQAQSSPREAPRYRASPKEDEAILWRAVASGEFELRHYGEFFLQPEPPEKRGQ